MPIVKSYDNLTVSKQVAPTVTARAPQVINTTKPLLQGIDNLNKGFQIYQEGVDETFSNDAYLQFQKERNKLLNDPDEGFFNVKGKNAYNNKDKALQQYNKLVAKYSSQMRGTAGEKLKLRMEESSISDANQIDRHVSTQFESYKTQTSLDGIAVSSETAVINYNDPEKANRAISDALSYVKTEALRKGYEPDQAIQSTMNDIVTKQVVNALLTEDVDGAKDLLKRYGSNVEGIRNLLEAKITKVEEDIYKRGEDERVASKALDVYQSAGSNYAVAVRRLTNDKTISADEKFNVMSKLNSLNEANNKARSEYRENIMRGLDQAVIMGGQPLKQWIATNKTAWDNLTSSQRFRYINKMPKAGGSTGSGSSKKIVDPNLIGTANAYIANGDRAGANRLLDQYKDSLPDKLISSLSKFIQTEDVKQLDPKELPPEINVFYQGLSKKEKRQYMNALGAAYTTRQLEQGTLPDHDDLVRMGRSMMDTFSDYEDDLKADGYNENGVVYSALRDATLANFKEVLTEKGIEGVKDEDIIALQHSYVINNGGKIPNKWDLLDMVDQEVNARQPLVMQLKTGQILVIDKLQDGKYIESNDDLVAYYKQNPNKGKLFDSTEQATVYMNRSLLKPKSNEDTVKQDVTSDPVKEPTLVIGKQEQQKALTNAETILAKNGMTVPKTSARVVAKDIQLLYSSTIDTLANVMMDIDSVTKPVRKFIVEQATAITESLKDGAIERSAERHADVIKRFKNNPDVFIASLVLQDPSSTPEEKQLADAYILMVQYGE